ncbi:hypothetical protein B0H14DRAFT_2605916 [Mycena olivaceomarginata]|nr:hypothetical protein B0H14DRAFT_2605916 [Mycena olivaceomarginata]
MSSITLRRRVVDRDTNKTNVRPGPRRCGALGDTILSKHEIDKTFFRVKPEFKGNIYYKNLAGSPSGLTSSPRLGPSNRALGRLLIPKTYLRHINSQPFTDDRVKSLRMILVLRCPTGAPESSRSSFATELLYWTASVPPTEVSEAERSQRFEITESTFCENGEGDLTDNIIMLLHLQQTFESNAEESLKWMNRQSHLPTIPAMLTWRILQLENVKLATYTPARMLPEVEGPLFALDKAQLRQHDYRDADGNLIAAHEIYHVLADKLRVPDHGDGELFVPTVPPMPERREPRTPAKRARDDAAGLGV